MDNAEQIVDAAIRRLRPQEKANDTAWVVSDVSVVPEPEWPKMDGAAYQGLAGEIVEAISPHTESDPVAILLQVLTFFGNAIGRNAYYRVEDSKRCGNLFVVLVWR
jgi:hypothetical protein